MNPTRKNVAGSVVYILFLASLIGNYILWRKNDGLRASLPYLTKGESIRHFDLVGADNRQIDVSVLKEKKVSLIYIFRQPCSTCNASYRLWRQIANIVQPKGVAVHGIVLSGAEEMMKLVESHIPFPVYIPKDKKSFVEQFRVRFNVEHTILCLGDTIDLVKTDAIDTDDFTTILKEAQRLIGKEKGEP